MRALILGLALVAGAGAVVRTVAAATPQTDATIEQEAKELSSRFATLTARERQRLRDLGPSAFVPLFIQWLDWDWKVTGQSGKPLEQAEIDQINLLFPEAYSILEAICTAEHTGWLVRSLMDLRPGNPRREMVRRLIESKGDERAYVAGVIDSLRARKPSDADAYELRLVALSRHPIVKQFFAEILKDAHAEPTWRKQAFVYLAGEGDRESLKAVQAARAKPVKPTSLLQPPDLSARYSKKLAELADARGRQWVLYQSDKLGFMYDLFIARKSGNTLERPLFTGLWTRGVVRRGAPPNNYGVSIEQLIGGEWIHHLPNDPNLRRDSDEDGLTDLVEARLGTDPAKKDTDGDGRRDAVDRFPNAAPRKKGDLERIVAACVEASFLQDRSLSPALISAPVEPFEFAGYDGLVLWDSERTGDLSKCWGGGVLSIGFISPNERAKRSDPDIEISPDRKTARTQISIAGGPLGGEWTEITLKKFGSDWYVVDWIVRAVS